MLIICPALPFFRSQVIGRFRAMQSEAQQYRRKIGELEQDLIEHKLVGSSLEPMDSGRRAYRLVGGVLVERTVGEVLPQVMANRGGIESMLQQLARELRAKEAEAAAWKSKYGITTQADAQAGAPRRQGGGGGTGGLQGQG
ncbi:unnamed protein product, partial [Phaeothamnion confervicola]